MDGGRSIIDVEVGDGGGYAIHIAENDDVRREPSDPVASASLEEVTAAAVREEIAAMRLERWAPWITPAVKAYVIRKGGPAEVDVSAVVADEMNKRSEYLDLFAAISDPTSEVAAQLRGLVSRIVSPVGVEFINGGNTVCDIVPRNAPGEPPTPPPAFVPWG